MLLGSRKSMKSGRKEKAAQYKEREVEEVWRKSALASGVIFQEKQIVAWRAPGFKDIRPIVYWSSWRVYLTQEHPTSCYLDLDSRSCRAGRSETLAGLLRNLFLPYPFSGWTVHQAPAWPSFGIALYTCCKLNARSTEIDIDASITRSVGYMLLRLVYHCLGEQMASRCPHSSATTFSPPRKH